MGSCLGVGTNFNQKLRTATCFYGQLLGEVINCLEAGEFGV